MKAEVFGTKPAIDRAPRCASRVKRCSTSPRRTMHGMTALHRGDGSSENRAPNEFEASSSRVELPWRTKR